jgi:hypothetical protein
MLYVKQFFYLLLQINIIVRNIRIVLSLKGQWLFRVGWRNLSPQFSFANRGSDNRNEVRINNLAVSQ